MRKATKIGLAVLIILLVVGGVGYAFYYNYTHLQFSFSDISVSNIELELNWQTIYYGIAGNPLLAALSTLHSIDLDLTIQIHNPGFLPVVIPSFDYTLYGNDIDVGPGVSPSSVTVSASSTEPIHITQRLTTSSLQQLVTSIVSKEGLLDVKVEGKAHLSSLPIDVPLSVSRSINIYQAIWDKIKDLLGIPEERVSTSMTLDQPPSNVVEGQTVTFTGRLVRSDTGIGVGATITIYDNDLVGDDSMSSGTTNSEGRFTMTWVAKSMDPLDHSVEVYAKYQGSNEFKPSSSPQYSISITVVSQTIATGLTLNQPPSSVSEGSVIAFTGRLVRSDTGAGVAGVVVKIFDSDFDFDDLIKSGLTDSNGNFHLEWTAKHMDPLDRTVEVYAKFDGTEDLEHSRSPAGHYVVEVESPVQVETVLTLDPPPSTAAKGSTVTFTGRLVEAYTGIPVAGAVIKIYESDVGFDDLMVSGTTRSDGGFSIEWTAKKMDWWDKTAETYAKFDGTTLYAPSRSSQYTITVS